jgi:hypothetical protein
MRDLCRTPCLKFGSRGEKDIERDTVVGFDLEKFDADMVFVHPLDRSEPDFHGWLVPGKIQHERELLAALKEVIDPEAGTLTGEIEQGAVLRVLRQKRDYRGLPCDGEAPCVATVRHRYGSLGVLL